MDNPVVWYEGSGASSANRRYLHNDHQGSIIAVSNPANSVIKANTYDTYGIPHANNLGRFSYTGQLYLSEIGLHYYKARIYSAPLGRFLQTDPVGYEDQMNLYAYVGNDPVNVIDPTGMFSSSFSTQAFNRHSGWMPGRSVPTASSPIPSSGTREISISVTASWGASVTGAAGIATDSKGNFAVTLTGGIGGGTPGASLEIGVTTTNAESVNGLQGPSGLTSIGGGEGFVGSATAVSGAGYTGTTISSGIGVGTPVSASGHVTATQVINLTESSPPPILDDKLKQ